MRIVNARLCNAMAREKASGAAFVVNMGLAAKCGEITTSGVIVASQRDSAGCGAAERGASVDQQGCAWLR